MNVTGWRRKKKLQDGAVCFSRIAVEYYASAVFFFVVPAGPDPRRKFARSFDDPIRFMCPFERTERQSTDWEDVGHEGDFISELGNESKRFWRLLYREMDRAQGDPSPKSSVIRPASGHNPFRPFDVTTRQRTDGRTRSIEIRQSPIFFFFFTSVAGAFQADWKFPRVRDLCEGRPFCFTAATWQKETIFVLVSPRTMLDGASRTDVDCCRYCLKGGFCPSPICDWAWWMESHLSLCESRSLIIFGHS